MSVEDNKRLALEFFKHFGTSNVDGLTDSMADDATWWIIGKPHLFPAAGTKTKAEAANMLRSMLSAYANGLDMKVISMIGEGDRIAAETRSYAITDAGNLYQNEYLFLLQFFAGRIVKVREYTDLMHVQEIFDRTDRTAGTDALLSAST